MGHSVTMEISSSTAKRKSKGAAALGSGGVKTGARAFFYTLCNKLPRKWFYT